MMSRRPPSDGGSSRPTHLPGSCPGIGRQLAGVRAARQLSVEDVASRLLLSKAQVMGLEAGDAAAFYTSAYFLRGLRKYMAFAGVPDELLDLSPPDEEEADHPDDLRLTLATAAVEPATAGPRVSGHTAWVMIVVVAAVLIGLATLGISRYGGATADISVPSDIVQLDSAWPLPAQPLRAAAVAQPPVQSIAAQLAIPDDGATVRLSVGKATWVFVRFPDNRVTERRLAAGEAFEVGPLPAYLAIGTADSVDLRVEDRPVALEPYIRNGQVRITRPELAALTGATPPR
ncbi:MAG: DUF4115 domain-containing protein [Acidobacteria bacterium]|nr:DUF4115 domain-containing protein [Acidobacteriota bacterium]